MHALEDSIKFPIKWQMSCQVMGNESFWIAAIKDLFCALLGRLSTYDYTSRVLLAQQRMAKLPANKKSSAKFVVEQILINLCPDPERLLLAFSGATTTPENSANTKMLPLDDSIIQTVAPELIGTRYAVLAEAFSRYISYFTQIAMEEAREQKIESDFIERYESFIKAIEEPVERMAEARRVLYIDYPEKFIRADNSETEKLDRTHPKKEENKDSKKYSRQLIGSQQFLKTQSRAIITAAEEVVEKYENIKSFYKERLEPLDELYESLRSYLSEETCGLFESCKEEYDEEINSIFDVNLALPDQIIKDLENNRQIYRGGFFA